MTSDHWRCAVSAAAAAAGAARATLSPATWLLQPSPLSLPPWKLRQRHVAAACVEADGRALSLLPLYFQRDRDLQARAALQILSQGAAWWAHFSTSFLESMAAGHVALPTALQAAGALLGALCQRPERLSGALREDGRALAVLPPWLRDNTVIGWAACSAPPELSGSRWLSLRLRDCFVFMRAVVRRDGGAYRWASARLRSSSFALLEAALVGGNGTALNSALPPLRHSKDAARLCVLATWSARALPRDVREKQATLLYLARLDELQTKLVGLGSCPALRSDALFQLELVRLAPHTISEVPLRRQAVFLRAALAVNPWLVGYATVEEDATRLDVLPAPSADVDRYLRRGAARVDLAEPLPKRARVAEELKCPICLELVCGRVVQCRNGHILCQDCVHCATACTLYRCPVCRVVGGLARNLVAEFLTDTQGSDDYVPT